MTKTERVDPAVLRVADAVGALMEEWGFKRNMGRMWAVLYLEDHPLSAAELGDRLGLSTGAVSMLLAELVQWGIVKKAWVVGERKEFFEAETSIVAKLPSEGGHIARVSTREQAVVLPPDEEK